MNINTLNSAERETLMIEALNALRVCIPNITRPAGVLINQNQPLDIEDKGGYYNVTMYVRAVDYSGKYLFLGPFHLTASLDDGHWNVSEPRFDPGIDGCYYDIAGANGSRLKIYRHMVAIDDMPVYFEDCSGVALRDCDGDNNGVVRFDLKDGRFKTFAWNTDTQNSVFMTKVLAICDLMINTAQQEAEAKAKTEAAKAAKQRMMRPAASATPAAPAEGSEPVPAAPVKAAPAEAPAKSPFSRPAAFASSPAAEEPAPAPANSPFARPAAAATRPGFAPAAQAAPEPAAPETTAPETPARPRYVRQSVTPEKNADKKPEKPSATYSGGQRRISLKSSGSGGIHNADLIGIHNPEVDAMKANREETPDDFESWTPEAAKSPFVPLKNPTPDMMPPKPEPGPAITHVYVGEWGSREKDMPPVKTNDEPEIKPMTAQSLAHIDDWKPARSVVISPEEEVAKYKRLLDVGAISQDEFELKKKQLLGF